MQSPSHNLHPNSCAGWLNLKRLCGARLQQLLELELLHRREGLSELDGLPGRSLYQESISAPGPERFSAYLCRKRLCTPDSPGVVDRAGRGLYHRVETLHKCSWFRNRGGVPVPDPMALLPP